jgi:hypothetical protein
MMRNRTASIYCTAQSYRDYCYLSRRTHGQVPSTKHLGDPAAIRIGWALTPKNHSPAFELIPASGAKPANQILAVASRPLAHDDAEVIATFRAVSRDVFSHRLAP